MLILNLSAGGISVIDYLVIGSGLFGAIVAHELHNAGKSVYVAEKRNHIGGMVYTESTAGINVHKYGAHIFRTDNSVVWQYVNKFTKFTPYIHSPIAIFNDEMYNLPFNMNTFSKLWNVNNPAAAKKKIQSQIVPCKYPKNLEEYALSTVGIEV